MTELENKVAKTFSKVLATPIKNEASLGDLTSRITLNALSFSEDLPNVMVVTMPVDLLIYAKQNSKELLSALKKELPKYMILFRREGEIPSPKINNPMKAREEILGDLVFPAVVAGRLAEVESRDEIRQLVYLDSKNQCWTKAELLALEKVLGTSFGQDFRVKIFGSGF